MKLLNYIYIFIICLVLGCLAASGARDNRPDERRFVVTLDAGHGGHDTGAVGARSREKDITLAVAKRLGELIDKNLGNNVKVIYTRDGDYFVTLDGRADIANEAKSDLFISIHINSVAATAKNRTTVEGSQVYTLGLHKTADNLAVEKRENSVVELEGERESAKGFDPQSQESDIVFELAQTSRLDRSIEFADAVLNELVTTAGRSYKGVRQAGFRVLWTTSMPAVLIELDFICNPTSEAFLISENGQQLMATAIYNAFCSYFNTYGSEVIGRKAQARRITGRVDHRSDVPLPPRREIKEQPVPLPPEKDRVKPVGADEGTQSKPAYRIQVRASTRPYSKRSPELEGVKDPRYYFEEGIYKYTVGPYSSEKKAKKELKKVREKFPDAFIVIFQNGRRTGIVRL